MYKLNCEYKYKIQMQTEIKYLFPAPCLKRGVYVFVVVPPLCTVLHFCLALLEALQYL